MRKVMKYPIYPITFSYVNGIFFANYFAVSSTALYLCIFLLLVFSVFLFLKPFRLYSYLSAIFLSLFCIVFFYLGAFQFAKQSTSIEYSSESTFYTLVINEKLKENSFSHRYYANVYEDGNKKGKLLIYQNKKEKTYEVGDVLYDKLSVQSVSKARIPYGFDYQNYLHSKSIYGQAYLTSATHYIGIQKNFMYHLSVLRKKLLDSYSPFYQDKYDQALIAGLLFGQKQDLDQSIEEAYRNTGVMHVLAVSGMHVMIIFFVLKNTLQFFFRKKFIPYLIIVLFLILFAFLSGLSGSVVRAVFMCIFFLVGQLLRKDSSSKHTLVVSMLIILWFAPQFIYDIGFQLSYLAVFSIIFIYPILRPYLSFKNKILNAISEMLGVSLAAQLGVCFLSIYYFQQFPIWFLLGNLVAIPTTSFVIISLLVQMPFNFLFPIFSNFIALINKWLLYFCNKMLLYMNSFETIVIDGLNLSTVDLIVFTCLIFSFIGFIQFKKVKYLYAFLLLAIGYNGSKLYNYHTTINDGIYLISDKNDLHVVNHFNNNMHIFSTGNSTKDILSLTEKVYVQKLDTTKFKDFLQLKTSILIIDSVSISYSDIASDVVVLKDNPKINLERVLLNTSCKMVVFHSNNAQWRRNHWKKILDKKNIPFHDMREKGYVVIE